MRIAFKALLRFAAFSIRLFLALSILIPIIEFSAGTSLHLVAQASVIPGVIALNEIFYGRIFS